MKNQVEHKLLGFQPPCPCSTHCLQCRYHYRYSRCCPLLCTLQKGTFEKDQQEQYLARFPSILFRSPFTFVGEPDKSSSCYDVLLYIQQTNQAESTLNKIFSLLSIKVQKVPKRLPFRTVHRLFDFPLSDLAPQIVYCDAPKGQSSASVV